MASTDDRPRFRDSQELRQGLDLLASPTLFASTNQSDYRWGRLHRIVFAHPLGGPFSNPAAGGAFPAPLAGCAAFPPTADSRPSMLRRIKARAQTADDFMFTDGPTHRTVVEARAGAMRAESIWPGGTSGVLGSPKLLPVPRALADERKPAAQARRRRSRPRRGRGREIPPGAAITALRKFDPRRAGLAQLAQSTVAPVARDQRRPARDLAFHVGGEFRGARSDWR